MVTDDSLMNFGRYKNKNIKLKNIPPSYLESFYRSNYRVGCTGELKELLDYLDFKYNFSKKETNKLNKAIDLVLNMCPKEVFVTESDAKYRMKYIKSINKTGKTPIRAYLCPRCGFWHLTSKLDYKYVLKQGGEVESSEEEKPIYSYKHKKEWKKFMKD